MMMLSLHALAGRAGKTLLQTASHKLNWSVETYKKQWYKKQDLRCYLCFWLLNE